MRRGIVSILAAALVLSLGLAAGLHAQATKDPKTNLDRLEGYVQDVDKTKSEITIRQRGSTNMEWKVVYTPDTKFTYRNAAATIDTVKKDLRVICEGSFGTEKTRMLAARIDVRTDK